MNRNSIRYFFALVILLSFLGIHQTSCSKDYSYEREDTTKKIPQPKKDSLPTPPLPVLSSCPLCKTTDSLKLGSWNFKNNRSYFCGGITDAGFIGTNTTLTFFGPSACSIDTGIVMTVFLPFAFNANKFNVETDKVAFYYYDHRGNTDMFIKLPPLPFSVTIQSYFTATGITTGTFKGAVYKPNGDTTYISDGRFKVTLK